MPRGATAALPFWDPLSWRLCIEPVWAAASKLTAGVGMLLGAGWVPVPRLPVIGLGSPPAVGGVLKPPACCTPNTGWRLPPLGSVLPFFSKQVH